jgi:hypothetical protein
MIRVYQVFPDMVVTHFATFIVARVQPRTSKGITDLLLLNLVQLSAACPSKKNVIQNNIASI